jgi:hypothetical protein
MNPFLLKEIWVGRRTVLELVAGARKPAVYAVAAVGAALLLWFVLGAGPAAASAILSFFWIAVLTGLALGITTPVFAREEELDALQTLELVPMSPLRRATGRWLAACARVGAGWLLGLPLAALWWLSDLGDRSSLVPFVAWVLAGLWLASLCAFGLACSAILRKTEAACIVALVVLIGLPVCTGPSRAAFVPPNFLAFGSISGWGESWVLAAWPLFIALMLALTARFGGVRQRVEGVRPAPPARRRATRASWLPSRNPIFRSYLAVPGSRPVAWLNLAAAAIVALIFFAPVGEAPLEMLGVGLTVACFLSFIIGASIGGSAMARERTLGTWSLLTMTGLDAPALVRGRLLCGMHALATLWLSEMVIWSIAVEGRDPRLLILMVWFPLSVLIGLLLGVATGVKEQARPQYTLEQQLFRLLVLFPAALVGFVTLPVLGFVGYGLSPLYVLVSLLGAPSDQLVGWTAQAVQVVVWPAVVWLLFAWTESSVRSRLLPR